MTPASETETVEVGGQQIGKAGDGETNGAGLTGGTAVSPGRVVEDKAPGGAKWMVVGVRAVGVGHDAVVEGESIAALSPENDAAAACEDQDRNHAELGAGQGNILDQSGGSGVVGWAGEGCGGARPGQGECDKDNGDSDSQCLEEHMLENKLTWELARESGAVLYNEEDDIMAILQVQNEEIAQKRKVAKQKAKMRREEKSYVWEELSYIAGLCQVPCCFMGDFNEIVNVEERKGIVNLPLSTEEFKIWMQDMHLVDLPLIDRKFTWFQGRSCSRIDRTMVSVEWLEEFPETRLRGRPRGLSDHCPIIVEDKRMREDPRPFRSLDSWFTHEGFLRMVKEEWRGLGELQFTEKLKALMGPLGRWHKDNFGEMDKKILKFEEEIKKVDDMGSSPLLGFRDGLVEKIDEEEFVTLEAMPSAEEIREAVRDCESSKVPGCDGYNMNFIKRCWDEIGAKFTVVVMGFFQTSRLPADSNITWVALAPKFIGAKEIKDLRPISMVGCVYKVISKVLVRWMRAVMPGLVGETQSAFMKGRKFHDGALITCETVH
ncbi:uncharacterized protein LOC107614805 [Arachis ipaensis]|uniref:uncharacterized protein LOC107614805 n=1 Tax=Arachis ipaensis TaxID=130454 RepID=UPI000A2B91F8|nr:uncharacterized protein LOC107614805 [Arachis ipaensis]XP_025677911.1 uncharacterized protein LOC112777735 [Arachis hypogaea]